MKQLPLVRRIAPGSPYPGRAEHWNQLVETSEKVTSAYSQLTSTPFSFSLLDTAVRVKTVQAQRVGEYVVLVDSLTDPQIAEGTFRANPVLNTEQSNWASGDTQWGRLAIMAEDAAANTIAWAYYTGTALAKLQRRYAYHDHADLNPFDGYDDNGTQIYPLVSHPSGSWQILWDDASPFPEGETPGWAVVRHRGVWDRTLYGTAQATIVPGTSGDVEIKFAGSDTEEIVNAEYRWTQGPTIGNGDLVEVQWQSDELVWTVQTIAAGAIQANHFVNRNVLATADENTYNQVIVETGRYSDPSGTITISGGNIHIASEGTYKYSYFLNLVPNPEFWAGSAANDIESESFRVLIRQVTPAITVPRQTYTAVGWANEGPAYVGATITAQFTTGSVSGSALLSVPSEGTDVILEYSTQHPAWDLQGEVIVIRH